MKFLRASESDNAGGISQCIERYPLLKDLVHNPYDFDSNPGHRLRLVRRHAVELAKDHAVDELNKLQVPPKPPPSHAARTREVLL